MSQNSIRLVITSLEEFLDKILKKLALDIVANLVTTPNNDYGTPVDTGWARSNWVPNIGSRVDSPTGSKQAVSGADQQAGTVRVVTSYRRDQGPIYISNAVPYIYRLNQGSSRQAPAGFVQNAIRKAVQSDLFGGGAGFFGRVV
jgi:hypothetical protein